MRTRLVQVCACTLLASLPRVSLSLTLSVAMAKAIENGKAQVASATYQKNWSQKDKEDDLTYFLYCLDMGQKKDEHNLNEKLRSDIKKCSSEEEKADLQQRYEIDKEKISERVKPLIDMVFGWKREFKTLAAVKEKVSAGTVEPTPGSSSDDKPVTRGELKAMWEQYQVNQQPVTLAIADQNKKLQNVTEKLEAQTKAVQGVADLVDKEAALKQIFEDHSVEEIVDTLDLEDELV